jgi:ABC-type Na+ efflux pump permease subunit
MKAKKIIKKALLSVLFTVSMILSAKLGIVAILTLCAVYMVIIVLDEE